MPCGVWKITDVPADKVPNVIGDFNLDSPTKVEKDKQADGTWTVTATFPDCPPGHTGKTISFPALSSSS
jgi:hypothetical protein